MKPEGRILSSLPVTAPWSEALRSGEASPGSLWAPAFSQAMPKVSPITSILEVALRSSTPGSLL